MKKVSASGPVPVTRAATPKAIGSAMMKPAAPAAKSASSNPISRLGAYAHPPKKSGKK
jgi:hypothetical protein